MGGRGPKIATPTRYVPVTHDLLSNVLLSTHAGLIPNRQNNFDILKELSRFLPPLTSYTVSHPHALHPLHPHTIHIHTTDDRADQEQITAETKPEVRTYWHSSTITCSCFFVTLHLATIDFTPFCPIIVYIS